METIRFYDNSKGDLPVDLYVAGEVGYGENSYILVTLDEDGDSEAMILKKTPADDDPEFYTYEQLSDSDELDAVISAFESRIDGISIE